MKKPREFRESELRQIAEIQYLIKSKGLNASVNKIKKWVVAQPDRLRPQFFLGVIRDLQKGIVYKQFEKTKINPKSHYTRAEAAELLNLSYGRVRQLEIEKVGLKPLDNKFNRGNRLVFLGADIIKYRRQTEK
ncbi:MAG: hypothetical protein ABII93_05700 [Chrysiogenia bacterium]